MSKLVKINPENPQERNLHAVAETLKNGGVIIYPTDTVYGLGCDIMNQKAIQRICQLKGVKVEKAELSFICSDLSNLSKYAAQIDNNIFKLMTDLTQG